MIASHYHIEKAQDWSKVSISLIRKRGGVVRHYLLMYSIQALLKRYNNSIFEVLQEIYPSYNWSLLLPSRVSSNQQSIVFKSKQFFPSAVL